MDGVRRWIGSGQHAPGTRNINDARDAGRYDELDGDGSGKEKDDLDPQSMETIVARSLAPVVKEKERAEYQL
jgi:hypothetical protein